MDVSNCKRRFWNCIRSVTVPVRLARNVPFLLACMKFLSAGLTWLAFFLFIEYGVAFYLV